MTDQDVNVIIKGPHLEITTAIKDYAEKKAQKLTKFFENIQKISIELDLNNTHNNEADQTASGTVWASGTVLKATETSKTLYSSIDLLVEKLQIQLKKHKEKLRDNNRGNDKRNLSKNIKTIQKASPSKQKKLYIPKPMGVDDALLLLEENKLPFLVFRNLETENINVIFPEENNIVGLIET